jgi:hypothetical protein
MIPLPHTRRLPSKFKSSGGHSWRGVTRTLVIVLGMALMGCDSKAPGGGAAEKPKEAGGETPKEAFATLQKALKDFDKAAVEARIAPFGANPQAGGAKVSVSEIADSLMGERAKWLEARFLQASEKANFAVVQLENSPKELTLVNINGRWLLGTKPFFKQLTTEEKELLKQAEAALRPKLEARPESGDERMRKAKTDIAHITAALKSYYADYSKFPKVEPRIKPDVEGGDAEVYLKDLIPMLTAQNSGPNKDHRFNPRQIRYMDIAEGRLTNGQMLDPWGQEYSVMLNFDGDEVLMVGNQRVNSVVAVWSCGPDGACQMGGGDDPVGWR